MVGKPWRGNLQAHINKAATASEFIAALFSLCSIEQSVDAVQVTLGVDTPLNFSEAFVRLVTGLRK